VVGADRNLGMNVVIVVSYEFHLKPLYGFPQRTRTRPLS
jgi:hypothetical protein